MSATRKTRKTRKSRNSRKGSKSKTIRRLRLKTSNKKVELKNKKLQLYLGSKLQTTKNSWVKISDGLIYISRDNNRTYWFLNKLKKSERPKITFNDKKQTIKVGNNKIVVTRLIDYNKSKALLEPYCK